MCFDFSGSSRNHQNVVKKVVQKVHDIFSIPSLQIFVTFRQSFCTFLLASLWTYQSKHGKILTKVNSKLHNLTSPPTTIKMCFDFSGSSRNHQNVVKKVVQKVEFNQKLSQVAAVRCVITLYDGGHFFQCRRVEYYLDGDLECPSILECLKHFFKISLLLKGNVVFLIFLFWFTGTKFCFWMFCSLSMWRKSFSLMQI